jgi:hypothetical protein
MNVLDQLGNCRLLKRVTVSCSSLKSYRFTGQGTKKISWKFRDMSWFIATRHCPLMHAILLFPDCSCFVIYTWFISNFFISCGSDGNRTRACALSLRSLVKGKEVKLSCALTEHHAMKAYWEWRYSSTHSLTSALDRAVVKRKIPSPRRESNPRTPIIQPVPQRYTDWAITALLYINNSWMLIYFLVHLLEP